MGHADAKRSGGPRTDAPDGDAARYFEECVLSADTSADGWAGVDIYCDHAGSERAETPGRKHFGDCSCGDWRSADRGDDLRVLRIRGPAGGRSRASRHERDSSLVVGPV